MQSSEITELVRYNTGEAWVAEIKMNKILKRTQQLWDGEVEEAIGAEIKICAVLEANKRFTDVATQALFIAPNITSIIRGWWTIALEVKMEDMASNVVAVHAGPAAAVVILITPRRDRMILVICDFGFECEQGFSFFYDATSLSITIASSSSISS